MLKLNEVIDGLDQIAADADAALRNNPTEEEANKLERTKEIIDSTVTYLGFLHASLRQDWR